MTPLALTAIFLAMGAAFCVLAKGLFDWLEERAERGDSW